MSAGSYDFELIRGNTDSLTLRFKDGDDALVDLTGSVMVFRAVAYNLEVLRKSTDDDIVMDDPTTGEITIPFSVDDTRMVPLGRLTKYELERRIDGREETLLLGEITGIGGVNDDAA